MGLCPLQRQIQHHPIKSDMRRNAPTHSPLQRHQPKRLHTF